MNAGISNAYQRLMQNLEGGAKCRSKRLMALLHKLLYRYPQRMAIPDYQTCMLPFLHFLSDSKEHSLREAEESLGKYFKLSDAERAELLPSGQQGIFKNRIGWARTYLKKACLIESPKRGVFKITDRGLNILSTNPIRIDAKFLEQFPEFMEFKDISKTTNGTTSISVPAAAILAATINPGRSN